MSSSATAIAGLVGKADTANHAINHASHMADHSPCVQRAVCRFSVSTLREPSHNISPTLMTEMAVILMAEVFTFPNASAEVTRWLIGRPPAIASGGIEHEN